MTKSTRIAAVTLGLVASSIAPLLAMDSAVTLPKDLFVPLTPKNFKDSKAKLLAGVRTSITGKLRPGIALDATMEGLAKAIDAFGGGEMSEPVDAQMDDLATVKPMVEEKKEEKAFDAEPFKNFLREKGMGEDDIAKACDMMPKAMAGDESEDDDEAKKKKAEAEKKANDTAEELKKAQDSMKDMVSKPAMDEAIKVAVADADKRARGIRVALDAVRPHVGELSPSLALDSADDVYRHAATMLGIEGAKDIHASALPTLIGMHRKAGSAPAPRLALDSADSKSFAERFPGADRIASA